MPADAYLAFDLGAGSGRALFGQLENDRLDMREIHRFENHPLQINGRLHWDLFGLYREMLKALSLCAVQEKSPPRSIGIDTWGVDFSLLDSAGNLLGLPVTYRDSRTAGEMERFFEKVPREKIYAKTGIQFLPFNSLYQLSAMVREGSPLLKIADRLLFMPDLFTWLLTGEKVSEFTFATTSQLFNPTVGDWDADLIDALGLSTSLFNPIVQPGQRIGQLSENVRRETGISDCPVVAVATHDTGSAVAAIPARDDEFAYISCGTWSLMGVETAAPVLGEKSLAMNFTNEGGVRGTYRLLKNIMGLWLLQRCMEGWNGSRKAAMPLTYDRVVQDAKGAPPFVSLVDPDSPEFLNPRDMADAIGRFCRRTKQPVPMNQGTMARCILESLALKYRYVLDQLRQIHARPIRRIHMIGGGVHNRLLCQFTANATNLPVVAGPDEATAAGNLLVQAMAQGRLSSLSRIRKVAANSFATESYLPERTDQWEKAYQRFCRLFESQ